MVSSDHLIFGINSNVMENVYGEADEANEREQARKEIEKWGRNTYSNFYF